MALGALSLINAVNPARCGRWFREVGGSVQSGPVQFSWSWERLDLPLIPIFGELSLATRGRVKLFQRVSRLHTRGGARFVHRDGPDFARVTGASFYRHKDARTGSGVGRKSGSSTVALVHSARRSSPAPHPHAHSTAARTSSAAVEVGQVGLLAPARVRVCIARIRILHVPLHPLLRTCPPNSPTHAVSVELTPARLRVVLRSALLRFAGLPLANSPPHTQRRTLRIRVRRTRLWLYRKLLDGLRQRDGQLCPLARRST